MTRTGGLPGGLISEVKNIQSGRVYFVSTAPEIGQDYWTTAILPSVQKKRFFGLVTIWQADIGNQIVAIIRNTMKEAHEVHAQVQQVITITTEDDWLTSIPSPAPPDGYSKGARQKLRDTLGYDPFS